MNDKIYALTMPKWGMTMTEGTVAEWLYEEGDKVNVGSELVEIETEKISAAIEAPAQGILKRIIVKNGSAKVASLIAVISESSVNEKEIDEFISTFELPEQEEISKTSEVDNIQFLEVDPHKIRVRTIGSGIDVLLIHGIGGDLGSWLFNQDFVANDFRVHAIDLPAHGESTLSLLEGSIEELGETVAKCMKQISPKPFHLVGHSLGGSVVMEIVNKFPDLVTSASLVNPVGFAKEVNRNFLEIFLTASKRKEMKEALTKLFYSSETLSRTMVENSLRHNRIEGVISQLQLIADKNFPDYKQATDWLPLLSSSSTPFQIIWGVHDEIIQYDTKVFPDNVPLIEIENAGHMVHMEQPTEFNQILKGYLNSQEISECL